MPFYKVTYSEQYRRATVHNRGCNFRCLGCAYKVREFAPVERWPGLDEIKSALASLDIERVHFMGGEPTTCPDLPDLVRYCKRDRGVRTFLGHTNGSNLPTDNLDGANVSLKAFSEEKHVYYTGQPAAPVFEAFRRAFEAGLEMKASTVYIPGLIDVDEVASLARFVGSLSPEIPFHIMGYIPIPGTPWPRPTEEQMREVVAMVQSVLKDVGFSHLTVDDARDLTKRDSRFKVLQVL
jgi:pyruvate formate lyase activating enzyme